MATEQLALITEAYDDMTSTMTMAKGLNLSG